MSSVALGEILLDQFRVDRFIASGGMATVYRVYDLKRNVALAMKVLQEDFVEDPVILKRFQREAEALTKLAHPNIVTFYGLFQAEGFAFLLERYIDGPTLKDLLRERAGQPRSVQEVAVYVKALCSVLGYAHTNELVHCDIKPGNVMIDHGGIVYLADFGIARSADSSTQTLASAGTPAYMAPEQILGMSVSPATDIYSMGVMLFELLTGRRPFTGNETGLETTGGTTGERVRYAHLNLQPPDPRAIHPALTPALAQVILTAMEKDPAHRYTSAQALFEAWCAATGLLAEQIPDRLDLSWFQAETPQAPVAEPTLRAQPAGWMTAPGVDSYPSPVPPPVRKRASTLAWALGAISLLLILAIVGVVFFILAGGMKIFQPGPAAVSPAQATAQETAELPLLTETISEPTEDLVVFTPISTQAQTVIQPALKTVTPTSANACPGAKPQRVRTGGKAYVCTKKDRLILRVDASLAATEVRRILTGTPFQVTGGPRCADSSSWWLIKTSDGVTGWVREGSDEVDPYFICPVEK